MRCLGRCACTESTSCLQAVMRTHILYPPPLAGKAKQAKDPEASLIRAWVLSDEGTAARKGLDTRSEKMLSFLDPAGNKVEVKAGKANYVANNIKKAQRIAQKQAAKGAVG